MTLYYPTSSNSPSDPSTDLLGGFFNEIITGNVVINIKIAGTFFRNENVILVQGSTQAPDRSGKTDQINDSVLISLPAPFDTPTMHDAGLLGIGFLVGAFFVLLVRR